MNTPDDMLTPEERALARLLGRPGIAATPSAQVDADLMALARKPAELRPLAAPRPVSGSRWNRRRSLVSSLAVAASLVLVVGLAWQLRPVTPAPELRTVSTDATPPPAVAPMAAPVAAPAPAEAQNGDALPAAAPVIASEPSGEASAKAPRALPAPMPRHTAPPTPVAPVAPPAPAPIARQDRANAGSSSYAMDQAPVAPASPAPVMAVPTLDEATADKADAAARAAYASRQRSVTTRPALAPQASADATGKVLAESVQQPLQFRSATAAPDIEADATLSRHQWLRRIRQRRDHGDLLGAHLSLLRFVQDYPEARIPRDLRPLLESPPPARDPS